MPVNLLVEMRMKMPKIIVKTTKTCNLLVIWHVQKMKNSLTALKMIKNVIRTRRELCKKIVKRVVSKIAKKLVMSKKRKVAKKVSERKKSGVIKAKKYVLDVNVNVKLVE